jgi:SpoVK/Ycf46/Vps4 family AAA+-type ATPase
MMIDMTTLFERRMSYPHPSARERLNRLVGLEDHKTKLTKVLGLLVHRSGLVQWGEEHHPGAGLLVDSVLNRPPLVILGGDVGSGKTELAESIGDAVARQEDIEVELLPLSLSARGRGAVGEMTQLIAAAFDFTVKEAAGMLAKEKKGAEGAVILLVDEADALAQSRETAQMHHEEISGVNAFIRGIDRLANQRLPAAVIMCTNRYDALDPAVKRRAAEILVFGRPDADRRRDVLGPKFGELGFSADEIEALVDATGNRDGLPGFTYSDLTQRLIPAIVLDAYPDHPILADRALKIANEMAATPPFFDLSSRNGSV